MKINHTERVMDASFPILLMKRVLSMLVDSPERRENFWYGSKQRVNLTSSQDTLIINKIELNQTYSVLWLAVPLKNP